MELQPDGVTTIADLLVARAEDQHLGLRTRERDWTWAAVVEESARRAGAADDLLGPGPRHIGIYLDNVPDYLFWIGAAALSGATVVGLNNTRRGDQLADEVRRTDCQLIVTDTAGRAVLEGLELGPFVSRILVIDEPGYVDLLEGYRGGVPVASGSVTSESLVLLLLTSGTTGASKAVCCSQGRLAERAMMAVQRGAMSRSEVCYCCMPLFHGNALMALWAPALVTGATVVLPRRFSASGFIDDARHFGVTYFTYVGKAIAYVLATPDREDDGRNQLVRGFGTEASPEDRRRFRERFGCELIEGYGSSESSGLVLRDTAAPEGALGRPAPHVQIIDPQTRLECDPAVLDPSGRVRNSDRAIGEIVDLIGAERFEGYYRDPAATAARLRHGWVWTGDLGYVDQDGFLYFAGRGGDWMRVDGENISAGLVERIVERHPDVLAAAVFGVPDPRTGDRVMLVVQLRPGAAFDPQSFLEYLLAQPDLGTKDLPAFVRTTEALPLTGSNKVSKEGLRREGWVSTDPVYGREARGYREYRLLTPADLAELDAELERHGRAHLVHRTSESSLDTIHQE